MAGSRLLVEASIHDDFVARLVAFTSKARLGDPRDPETEVGSIATAGQRATVLDYTESANRVGALGARGGARAVGAQYGEGWFVQPTIFTGVTNDMRIAQEEVFGPVLSVIKFQTDDEAVSIANDSRYGLAAGVWTRSIERALSLPKRLKAGTVWVNAYRVVSYLAPFGGCGEDGPGDLQVRLRQLRPGLRRDQAALCAREDLRRDVRGAGFRSRQCPPHHLRRRPASVYRFASGAGRNPHRAGGVARAGSGVSDSRRQAARGACERRLGRKLAAVGLVLRRCDHESL